MSKHWDRGLTPKKVYEATADDLTGRILRLIEKHPEILDFKEPWPLLKVPGFKCDDLDPTLFQAAWALKKAQEMWVTQQGGIP